MKMEKYDFSSTHPHLPFTSSLIEFNSHLPLTSSLMEFNSHLPFTSSLIEFNNMPNSVEPNIPPLVPYEPDFPCLPLQFHHSQLTDFDFSIYSSEIQNPETLPLVTVSSTHHRLPPLSVSSTSSAPKPKRCRLDLTLSHSNNNNNPQTLDSIVQSFKAPPPISTPIIPCSELARKRRQKLSDKTRCLQKLMPWDKKMDTCTMLQEAYKYIQFLEAQVSILESMPITSSFFPSIDHQGYEEFGGLGRLNRQQLLQVLVNSQVAQTMLCSEGSCVFAHEQLVSLHKAKEKKTVLQHFLCG